MTKGRWVTGGRPAGPRVLLLGLITLMGCEPAEGPDAADRAREVPAAERYTPSLATQMLELQVRHASLWFAAEAENWPLVDYMLHEIEELVELMEEVHPTYRDVPIGRMLGEVTLPTIEEMEDLAEQGDRAGFVEAYHRLTDACNACHVAAERGMLVIQRPETPPLTNLRFRP